MKQTIPIEWHKQTMTAPADLREQVGECVLIRWALEAVQVVPERLPGWSVPTEGGVSPRVLLTLLTYCYATGTYGSEDIEWSCQREPDARYICAGASPNENLIRHFRKANRPWIEECLARVYVKARGLEPSELARAEAAQPAGDDSLAARFRDRARRTVELATMFDAAMKD